MRDSRSARGSLVHRPLGPRKSGIPDSVEMPAPVRAVTAVASRSHPATISSSWRSWRIDSRLAARGRLLGGMDFIDRDVAAYMRRLCDRYDEPVLLEMEALGEERHFPIVGRVVGSTLELLTRSVRARRVFEMGSGFGFSAYWFARAVGETGEVHLTDTDAANAAA